MKCRADLAILWGPENKKLMLMMEYLLSQDFPSQECGLQVAEQRNEDARDVQLRKAGRDNRTCTSCHLMVLHLSLKPSGSKTETNQNFVSSLTSKEDNVWSILAFHQRMEEIG
ncbi:hypothetical protein OTU49_001904 [Cherax quadricarinatus]|uniref:Uncharacterized protein n=1 Tax=Cherax quadricarinatus TaxID=27406 RepID=A0AAW0XT06_CHEQU